MVVNVPPVTKAGIAPPPNGEALFVKMERKITIAHVKQCKEN